MDEYGGYGGTKKKIIEQVKKTLNNKVEAAYIIGSFNNEKWDKLNSDIDLVCTYQTFFHPSYLSNLKELQNSLKNLDIKFDFFLFTEEQFEKKLRRDLLFASNIQKGARLF